METVALARHAMATRFEIVLHGKDPIALRAAAEEALTEVERLDAQLSLYQPASEISFINMRAAHEPVRVEPRLYALLTRAKRLQQETGGAFDITIAPLMRCWGFMAGGGALPDATEIAKARAKVGMQWVELNDKEFTVRFLREGVMLDLGAIGKGHALEMAAEILREDGVTSALLHGGTSTVYAIGAPPGEEGWKIAIEQPDSEIGADERSSAAGVANPVLAIALLRDEAMSVSAVHGKSFTAEGRTYGHVIDPRSGQPTQGAALAAVVLPSATETDALSTALLTVGLEGHDTIANLRSGMRTLVAARSTEIPGWKCAAQGFTARISPGSS
jgi:FAD:protein FMN transferase